jgi:hypothetical protein
MTAEGRPSSDVSEDKLVAGDDKKLPTCSQCEHYRQVLKQILAKLDEIDGKLKGG